MLTGVSYKQLWHFNWIVLQILTLFTLYIRHSFWNKIIQLKAYFLDTNDAKLRAKNLRRHFLRRKWECRTRIQIPRKKAIASHREDGNLVKMVVRFTSNICEISREWIMCGMCIRNWMCKMWPFKSAIRPCDLMDNGHNGQLESRFGEQKISLISV